SLPGADLDEGAIGAAVPGEVTQVVGAEGGIRQGREGITERQVDQAWPTGLGRLADAAAQGDERLIGGDGFAEVDLGDLITAQAGLAHGLRRAAVLDLPG